MSSIYTPYQQRTPDSSPNGIAIDQASGYTETIAPEHTRHEISMSFGIDPEDMLKRPAEEKAINNCLNIISHSQ